MYKFFENIKLAVKAIWGKKIRSFLTMLGVIIGVFSIVLLIGIGEGVKSEVTSQVESLGSNIIMILPGAGGMSGGPMAAGGSFTIDDVERENTTNDYFRWNTKDYDDGTHELLAVVTDKVGNVCNCPSIEVVVDNTKPNATIENPTANSIVSGFTTISTEYSDNIGILNTKIFIDVILETTNLDSNMYEWDTTEIDDGYRLIKFEMVL